MTHSPEGISRNGLKKINFPRRKWRVKAHGIQVVKLGYLGRNEFRVLKKLRDRFVGRLLWERKGPGEAKNSSDLKNRRFISPIRDVLSSGRVNPSSGYEATPIWNTRDSLFWAWRRVGECLREWFGEADSYREALMLMRS